MVRIPCVLALAAAVLATFARADGPSDDDLKKKPITTDNGEIGKLLTRWHKDGTAAGNVGDWYDNRDGEHSPLDLRPWPQLQKIQYSDEDVKTRRNWAFMPRVRDHVTFGNSSTSGPPEYNGSNPRSAYCARQGLQILEKQYLGSNLYIYPEHRDHDPGHNGVGDGYGDTYPTNTPYLIISQGSSGSDQPFMRAVPFTLAAFRPDVKKKLVETGLLMPAVQMIFRRSNKNVAGAKEYLSGKAHPTVFEGGNVDALKMVKLAHEITADTIPPLVKLKVTKEDSTEAGKDFFEPPVGLSEQLADTSSVIARIWRGPARTRTLLVSAEGSTDVNKKELTFKWVLLRGDEKRVTITPKNKSGSVAEVRVEYHERRPIAPNSPMESNRVDVGVFAHNGSYYSAPAFVTFYSFDNEARTYDDKGKPIEIGYGMSDTELKVADFVKLFAELGKDSVAAKILGVTAEQRKEFSALAKAVEKLDKALAEATKKRQVAEAARNKAADRFRKAEAARKKAKGEDEVAAAEKEFRESKAEYDTQESYLAIDREHVTKAEKARNDALDSKREALKAGARPFVTQSLLTAANSPTWWNDHAKTLRARYDDKDNAPRRGRVDAARKRLVDLGVVKDGNDHALTFTPARSGSGDAADRLTAYEREQVKRFNAAVLTELILPGLVTAVSRTNFVDGRLTVPKAWRDVYRPDGGWTRYAPGAKPAEFTSEGWLVVKKDDKDRPAQARTVVYKQDPAPKGTRWVNPNPLRHAPGDELITFEYDGDRRKVKSREKVQE
jgi:hypothetical protein